MTRPVKRLMAGRIGYHFYGTGQFGTVIKSPPLALVVLKSQTPETFTLNPNGFTGMGLFLLNVRTI